MGKFVWKDNIVVDFGDGVTFEVPNDTGFVKETVLKANNAVQAVVDKKPDDDKACINALLDAIDKILGDGATGKIFSGHKLNLCNTMNAYIFIVDEIIAQVSGYDEMLNNFTEKAKRMETANAIQANDAAKQEVLDNAVKLGVTLSSMPARPRL